MKLTPTPIGSGPPPGAVADSGPPSRGDDAARRSSHGFRSLAVLVLSLGLVVSGFLIAGFFQYTDTVTALAPPSLVTADGIVVLTGGTDRITGAVELLADGKARRLLISGVHPGTSADRIARTVDADPALMACCIDLDRRAANTIGNALQTAKWARLHGFLSLIVVTSAYHMPRSMLELGHAMPEIRLIPYPVTSIDLSMVRWRDNRGVLLLLLDEYLKYAATRVRLALGGIDGLNDLMESISG